MAYKTREKLIEVARQLFVHKGLENTTMNDIASASEKGRRTIYTYFKNKKEIFNAVLEHETDLMVSEMKKIVDSPLPPHEKLRQFIELRFEQGVALNSSSSSIRSLFRFDVRRLAKIRRMVDSKEALLLNEIFNQGIQAGQFNPLRVELIKKFLLQCISSMNLTELENNQMAQVQTMRSAFALFITSDVTNPSLQ